MFGIDGYTFPAARTYDEVKRLYEASKPLKNDSEWRCLRDKRSNDRTGLIRKNLDEYVLKLYHSEIVRWTPDKVTVNRHDSMSSAAFVDRYLPSGYRASVYANRMAINQLHADAQWVFNKIGDDWELDTTTLTQYTRYSLDRKVLAQMRKRAKPFIDYVAARNALTQQHKQPYRLLSSFRQAEMLASFKPLLDDIDAFPKLYAEVRDTFTAGELSKSLPTTLTIMANGIVTSPLPPGQKPREPEWFSGHKHLISV
jgi:hypothetical protein